MSMTNEEFDLSLIFTREYGGYKYTANQAGMTTKEATAHLNDLRIRRPNYYARLEKQAQELNKKLEDER